MVAILGRKNLLVSLDGFLVTVDDEDENTWLFDTFASWDNLSRHLWTGLSDAGDEGAYRWHDGTPFLYRNWGEAQPSAGGDLSGFCSAWADGQPEAPDGLCHRAALSQCRRADGPVAFGARCAGRFDCTMDERGVHPWGDEYRQLLDRGRDN